MPFNWRPEVVLFLFNLMCSSDKKYRNYVFLFYISFFVFHFVCSLMQCYFSSCSHFFHGQYVDVLLRMLTHSLVVLRIIRLSISEMTCNVSSGTVDVKLYYTIPFDSNVFAGVFVARLLEGCGVQ